MMGVPRAMPETDHQPEELSFEEAMESLDAIVASLEGERLPLEEMVSSYERGMKLLRVCRGRIETARQRVEVITADLEGKGRATLDEFASMDTPETTAPATTEAPKRATKKKPAAPEPPAGESEGGEIRLF